MQTKHRHKIKIATALAVLLGVLVLAGFIIVFRLYPIAMVGSSFISARELETSISIARKLDPSADKKEIFDQLIRNKQISNLTRKVDVNEELKFYKTNNENYGSFLNKYFSGNEKRFIQYVVTPQAQSANLKIKYNSDFGANNDAYNQADNIIRKLNEGQTFEELAKQYSDDKVSGQLGGDIGYVSNGQILPELMKFIQTAKLGEVHKQIVVSRDGYHIIYPIEKAQKNGETVWHIKHILIQTSGYDSWLQAQISKVGVRRFIRL